MKKISAFILILFIFFIFQIRFAQGLSLSQCRYFNLLDGTCLSGSGYFWQEITEVPPGEAVPPEATQAPPATFVTPSVTDAFFSLTLYFFMIVLLTVILVLLLESLIETH
jgi:hypothetical protein